MCGCGSVGRASPCQGEGRGFESRHPLRGAGSAQPQHSHGGLAERLGTGLQSRLHRFESGTHLGRLAQRERASLTRKRSLVRSQYRPRHNVEGPSSPARAFSVKWPLPVRAQAPEHLGQAVGLHAVRIFPRVHQQDPSCHSHDQRDRVEQRPLPQTIPNSGLFLPRRVDRAETPVPEGMIPLVRPGVTWSHRNIRW